MDKIFDFSSFTNYKIVPFQYFMKNFDDTFSMWMHKHEYIEIMYTNSGTMKIDIAYDSSMNNVESYDVSQGKLVFLAPNVLHQLKIEKGKTAFIFNTEFKLEKNSIDDKDIDSIIKIDFKKLFSFTKLASLSTLKKGFAIINDTEQVGTALKELILSLNNNDKSIESRLSIYTKELNFFTEIAKCLKYNKMGSVSYIRKTNAYIMENYNKKITIDDICSHVNISNSYLKHQYKLQMGQTIHAFINVLRVQKAAKLLLTSSLSINDIAITVGFTDKNQLNYEFKKLVGRTPSSYRISNGETKIDFTNIDYYSSAINPIDIIKK